MIIVFYFPKLIIYVNTNNKIVVDTPIPFWPIFLFKDRQ